MELNEILLEVTEIYRKVLEDKSVLLTEETTANDVEGWDSMNHTILISEVEKYFNLRFKLKEMLGFKNVGDMIRTIHAKQQGADQ